MTCMLIAATVATVNPRIVTYGDLRMEITGPRANVYYCSENKTEYVPMVDERGNRYLIDKRDWVSWRYQQSGGIPLE